MGSYSSTSSPAPSQHSLLSSPHLPTPTKPSPRAQLTPMSRQNLRQPTTIFQRMWLCVNAKRLRLTSLAFGSSDPRGRSLHLPPVRARSVTNATQQESLKDILVGNVKLTITQITGTTTHSRHGLLQLPPARCPRQSLPLVRQISDPEL